MPLKTIPIPTQIGDDDFRKRLMASDSSCSSDSNDSSDSDLNDDAPSELSSGKLSSQASHYARLGCSTASFADSLSIEGAKPHFHWRHTSGMLLTISVTILLIIIIHVQFPVVVNSML